MEATDSATKYVVYSKSLHKYWSINKSKSLYYNEESFNEHLDRATLFVTQNNASDRAAKMHKYDAVVVPVIMTVRLDKAIESPVSQRTIQARKLVDQLNNMTDREEDRLTNAQLKKYKNARKYLSELGMI